MASPIRKNYYKKGSHNVISDISGQKFKRSSMVFDWRGLLMDRQTEYAPKQPQLTIRAHDEHIAVTDGTRTQGADPPLLDPPFKAEDGI